MSKRLNTLGTALVALALIGPVRADEKIYEATLSSTAWVVVPRSGTAAVIDLARKRLLTNYHVVGDKTSVLIVFPYFHNGTLVTDRNFFADEAGSTALQQDGRLIKGRVIAHDAKRDLALLEVDRLPEGTRALVPAAASPRPGQRIHSIGNPAAVTALWVYTAGRVKAVFRAKFPVAVATDPKFELDARVVLVDSALYPGCSGSPAVNDQGQLIGLAQSTFDERLRGCSAFIDITEIKNFLAAHGELVELLTPLLQQGKSPRP